MAQAWASFSSPPASAAGKTAVGGGDLMGMLLPLVIIGFIFYFLVFRPENQRQKEHKKMLDALKKGDRVLTTGGLYGVVQGVHEKDGIVVLKIAENVKVEVTRSSITSVKDASAAGDTPISS